MIDEDRTTWTLGQLADEVIEACELPMGCRGTIIAALADAKAQGRAASTDYAGLLQSALEDVRALFDGEADASCEPGDHRYRPNRAMQVEQIIDAALAKNPNPAGQPTAEASARLATPEASRAGGAGTRSEFEIVRPCPHPVSHIRTIGGERHECGACKASRYRLNDRGEWGPWLESRQPQMGPAVGTPQTDPAERVQWIVNDNAELGVMVDGVAHFLYKGESLIYKEGTHDDGMPMMYRMVGKREFGECCHPLDLQILPRAGQYRKELRYTPGLSFGQPSDAAWRELPRMVLSQGTLQSTERSASAQPDREAISTGTPGVATRVQGSADFQGTPHGSEGSASPLHPSDSDPLYDQAVQLVLQNNRASISLVQRHLRIGYNRAARLLEEMELQGIVTPMAVDGTRQMGPAQVRVGEPK